MPQAQNTKAAERLRSRIKLTAERHPKTDDKAWTCIKACSQSEPANKASIEAHSKRATPRANLYALERRLQM
jgi:hypothetical protein